MANLNLDRAKTAVLSMDIQKATVRRSFGTALESMLRSRDLDTVVLMGVATEFVVEAAARHAADADFRVIVLEDCCASFSDDAHRVSLQIMDHLATLATSADFLESVR